MICRNIITISTRLWENTDRYGESFREIKLLALFLQDFGEELCAMKPRFPEPLMDNAEDLQTLRTCVREKDGRGYLFVNNHQRLYPMKTMRR